MKYIIFKADKINHKIFYVFGAAVGKETKTLFITKHDPDLLVTYNRVKKENVLYETENKKIVIAILHHANNFIRTYNEIVEQMSKDYLDAIDRLIMSAKNKEKTNEKIAGKIHGKN